MKIAILNSHPTQNTLLSDVFALTGHVCQFAESGKELLNFLRRSGCDMLITDLYAADEGAHEVLAWARQHLPAELPVLLMVDRGTAEATIVSALNAGANDYIVKPIRREELKTRIQVLLRRAYPLQSVQAHIQFNHIVFEVPTGQVTMSGHPVQLTQKEFNLALLFFRNLGRPLSRAHIQEAVWGQEAHLPTRTMDTHVSRVRNKLQLLPEKGYRLTPVYSYGYQLQQIEE